jgi:hypothetical protein
MKKDIKKVIIDKDINKTNAKNKKKRHPRFKPYISVSVYYEGFDENTDKVYNKLAKEFGGKEEGSGYGFGQRDVGFTFYDLKSASDFAKKALKLKSTVGVQAECELYYV